MSVRVRFAPSPTGYVHIGSLRTALYDYLYAKKKNGSYILRIEDTDRNRFVEDALENLLMSLNWAGIVNDEGVYLNSGNICQNGDYAPYIQSERLDIYKQYVDQLVEQEDAYYCFCSKERLDEVRAKNKNAGEFSGYDGHCRHIDVDEAKKRIQNGESYVVRLKLPKDKEVIIDDLVRGKVVMNTRDLDDQVLLKADGFPTYHMAVVVDDYLMKITHIIRGEEWLPSTPKHIVLYEKLGWEVPKYAHLPNILNSDKKKLSKRHGDVSVADFKQKGYLPEALVNFLALIGWHPEGDQEIMSLDEMVQNFSFDRVSKSGGVFDVNKLNWMNNQYIVNADLERLVDLSIDHIISSGVMSEEDIVLNKEWIARIIDLSRPYLDYLSQVPSYVQSYLEDDINIVSEDALEMLQQDHMPVLIDELIKRLDDDDFSPEQIKKHFKAIQQAQGIKGKNLFMGSRVAITGSVHGADLMKTISILGKDRVQKRLSSTLKQMKK